MKKILFITAVGLIPLALIFLGFKNRSGDTDRVGDKADSPAKPLIAISKPEVSLLSEDGRLIRVLANGEMLDAGSTIEVSSGGEAKIYMPDGSVLRLDSGTKIVLHEGSYDEKSGTLLVRVGLIVGKVWSKVIELATPASVWEVKTSNAVATVRGTAFGMSTDGNLSKVFGSQHQVFVQAVDPKTGENVPIDGVLVGEGKFVELRNDDIESMKANRKSLAVADISTAVSVGVTSVNNWIRANEVEDAKIESRVNEIRSRGAEGKELKRELIKEQLREIRVEFNSDLKSDNIEDPDNTKPIDGGKKDTVIQKEAEPSVRALINKDAEVKPAVKTIQDPVNKIVPVESTKLDGQNTDNSSNLSPRKTPIGLKIESGSAISTLSERENVQFKAFLTFSDGTREDVTSSVDWKAQGPVGVITSAGIFSGKLSAEVAELGEASGVVTAVWRGGGQEFFAQTPVFKVLFKFDDGLIDIRG